VVTSALVGYAPAPAGDRIVPRPVLHPVHTAAGVLVTGAEPADHPWHRGIGIGLPDVDGINLWGGPSYVPGVGYDATRKPHGLVVGEGKPGNGRLEDRLRWCRPDGTVLLTEERRIDVVGCKDRLTIVWSSVLRSHRDVTIGSPASSGRAGAGYGGFFWRLPDLAPSHVVVRTAQAEGEEAVNGTRSPWLEIEVDEVWRARLTPTDARTAGDPWFVRVQEYVGVGSSLAAERPLQLPAGDALAIGMRIELVDLAGGPR